MIRNIVNIIKKIFYNIILYIIENYNYDYEQ